MTPLAERSAILAPTGLEPMLNTNELRAHYGVSLWTVNQWRRNGCPMERLPGGRRRFNLTAVRQWLAAQDEAGAEISAERSRKAVAARTSQGQA